MKLFEFEGKEIFTKYGLQVPNSQVIKKGDSIVPRDCVLKAQVLVGGRGKAGGILLTDVESFQRNIDELFGKDIKGHKVEFILVEDKIDIQKEIYCSISVNRDTGKPIFLISMEGGVDIEELAKTNPDKIIRKGIPKTPDIDFFNSLGSQVGVDGISKILQTLYKIFTDYDAELVEINPLAMTSDGLVAADSKILIDDNSLYRHTDYIAKKDRELSPLEIEAKKAGLSYVDLDGDIGIIGNGAGLVMATLDFVTLHGGHPSNFLDLGGGSGQQAMEKALKILNDNDNAKKILINIFGGITRCDEMARGIVSAKKAIGIEKPIVIRLTGTNEEEGLKVLNDENIKSTKSLVEAIQEVVALKV